MSDIIHKLIALAGEGERQSLHTLLSDQTAHETDFPTPRGEDSDSFYVTLTQKTTEVNTLSTSIINWLEKHAGVESSARSKNAIVKLKDCIRDGHKLEDTEQLLSVYKFLLSKFKEFEVNKNLSSPEKKIKACQVYIDILGTQSILLRQDDSIPAKIKELLLTREEEAIMADRVLKLSHPEQIRSQMDKFQFVSINVKRSLIQSNNGKAQNWNVRSKKLWDWTRILLEDAQHPSMNNFMKVDPVRAEAVLNTLNQMVLWLTCIDDIADNFQDSRLTEALIQMSIHPTNPKDPAKSLDKLLASVSPEVRGIFKDYIDITKEIWDSLISNIQKIVDWDNNEGFFEENKKDFFGKMRTINNSLIESASMNERMLEPMRGFETYEEILAGNMMVVVIMYLEELVIASHNKALCNQAFSSDASSEQSNAEEDSYYPFGITKEIAKRDRKGSKVLIDSSISKLQKKTIFESYLPQLASISNYLASGGRELDEGDISSAGAVFTKEKWDAFITAVEASDSFSEATMLSPDNYNSGVDSESGTYAQSEAVPSPEHSDFSSESTSNEDSDAYSESSDEKVNSEFALKKMHIINKKVNNACNLFWWNRHYRLISERLEKKESGATNGDTPGYIAKSSEGLDPLKTLSQYSPDLKKNKTPGFKFPEEALKAINELKKEPEKNKDLLDLYEKMLGYKPPLTYFEIFETKCSIKKELFERYLYLDRELLQNRLNDLSSDNFDESFRILKDKAAKCSKEKPSEMPDKMKAMNIHKIKKLSKEIKYLEKAYEEIMAAVHLINKIAAPKAYYFDKWLEIYSDLNELINSLQEGDEKTLYRNQAKGFVRLLHYYLSYSRVKGAV